MGKKNFFFVYDGAVFFEIVLLSYFLNLRQEVVYFSIDGKNIKTFEGFEVVPTVKLEDIDVNEINSLIITGGQTDFITNDKNVSCELYGLIEELYNKDVLVASICGGINIVKNCKFFEDVNNILVDTSKDLVVDKNLITANPNAYVDFAIEVAKYLGIFNDEDDVNETIAFFKYFQNV